MYTAGDDIKTLKTARVDLVCHITASRAYN